MNNPSVMKELLIETLKKKIKESTEFLNEDDIDALTDLCIMSVSSTGKENPKEMCSRISDVSLNTIIANKEKYLINDVTKRILPILVIEWCGRNQYLQSDWKWEWEGKTGKLRYLSKMKIEDIPFPKLTEAL